MGFELNPGERGVLIGKTRIGKSTLATDLILRFLAGGSSRRILIIDSKPRYRATHEARGLAMRYTDWVKGDTIPGSVAVTRVVDLKQAWKLSRVVILQSMTADGRAVEDFEDIAAELIAAAFRASGERRPVLVYVDEYYDLLKGALAAIADRRVLQSIRAGGERNLAVLVGVQRPKSIPLATLTESTKLYIFQLRSLDDIAYLRKYGPLLRNQPSGHQFVFYEDQVGGRHEEKLMQLRLAA